MKKFSGNMLFVSLLLGFLSLSAQNAFAKNSDQPIDGKVSGKSVAAGALSFLIWPGIGQAVNNNKGEKVFVHAVFGIIPIYRFWSGYDALMDRKGGYWEGRI